MDSKNKSRQNTMVDDGDSDEFELNRGDSEGKSLGSSGSDGLGPAGKSPFNDANAVSSTSVAVVGRMDGMDNRSEESILGESYRREGHARTGGGGGGDLERGEGPGSGGGGFSNNRNSGGKKAMIQVTEEWVVTRE